MRNFSLILLICWAKIASAAFSCDFYDTARPARSFALRAGETIVINEIFANPGGNALLPVQEFVELWNPSTEPVVLTGWSFSDLRSKAVFGADTLAPGAFLLICSNADVAALGRFGKVHGISPWPALNNDEDMLTLSDAEGRIADQVRYDLGWYRASPSKGLSLERIKAGGTCGGRQNWLPCTDAGGITPGRMNTVAGFHDQAPPVILAAAAVAGDSSIILAFSGEPDTATSLRPASYKVNNGMGAPATVVPEDTDFRKVRLNFAGSIPRNREYLISTPGLRDCAGRPPARGECALFVPDTIAPGDVLISELLCNPRPGGVDFVELYNASAKTLDLSGLHLARADTLGKPADIRPLSATALLADAGSYRAFSINPAMLSGQYPQAPAAMLVGVGRLPAYYNQSGSVLLLQNGRLIDRLDYTEGMHHPLLQNMKGVSLERSDFNQPAFITGNFSSASAAAGYATPGYRNSRQADSSQINRVVLGVTTFSPDGDGRADVLPVHYKLAAPDNLATLTVYTDRGVKIRILLRNEVAGGTGTVEWDGRDEQGRPCPAGVYLVHFSSFGLKGTRFSTHKACVLARNLN
ncbi:lamin tail domain-containing protein [Pedobacter yulinensis]|nr:lamin tail domain-containing protein [Pedobacter yulinensis]